MGQNSRAFEAVVVLLMISVTLGFSTMCCLGMGLDTQLSANHEAAEAAAKASAVEAARQAAIASIPVVVEQARQDQADALRLVQASKAAEAIIVLNGTIDRLNDVVVYKDSRVDELLVTTNDHREGARCVAALAFGQSEVDAKSYIEADATYEAGEASCSLVPPGDLRKAMKVDSAAKTIARRRTSIAGKVEAEKAEQERLKWLAEACGDAPRPSSWDGEIGAVERAVKQTAHDPRSIEVTDCTTPGLTDRCWLTTCTVRGKNAFGAVVAQSASFYVMVVDGANVAIPAE